MTDRSLLQSLVLPGQTFTVRVTSKASRNRIVIEKSGPPLIRVYVTNVPEDGKANAAVIKLLAKEIGVAKTRLKLLGGARSREKTFLVE